MRRERLDIRPRNVLFRPAHHARDYIGEPARYLGILCKKPSTLSEQVELAPAGFDDAVRARDETPKLLHPGQQRRPEIGLQVLGEFRQGVQRAFERQRQQRQLGRLLGRRRLQQRAVDAQFLDLGPLKRRRGGEGVRPNSL